jgi:two-component system response regulator AtoC
VSSKPPVERDTLPLDDYLARPRPKPAGLQLLVVGERGIETIALKVPGEMTVGRGPECEVRIDDPSVSRKHALIKTSPRVEVSDLESFNGTLVEGRRLAAGESVEVQPGEVVKVGTALLMVQGAVAASPSRAAPRDAGAARQQLELLIERIAPSDLSVLFQGESGSGKEVAARRLHALSRRAEGPWVAVNCAAIPESLIESELFGFEKGAFTGADRSKVGLLESAAGGTVFLDEVGDLPPAAQAKLLRVLEQREITRVGGVHPVKIDVRFISATHRNLERDVSEKKFRSDLYFRLNGICLRVPPLRERTDEIEGLARGFLETAASAASRPVPGLAPETVKALFDYGWPGNVRELRNVMERLVALSPEGVVRPEQLALGRSTPDDEKRRIERALVQCAGNQSRAAELLGISRRTLVNRLGAYRIARPRKSRAP